MQSSGEKELVCSLSYFCCLMWSPTHDTFRPSEWNEGANDWVLPLLMERGSRALSLGKWEERWAGRTLSMSVISFWTTEQRIPRRRDKMTKVMTIAALWQEWIPVHKLGCARETLFFHNLTQFQFWGLTWMWWRHWTAVEELSCPFPITTTPSPRVWAGVLHLLLMVRGALLHPPLAETRFLPTCADQRAWDAAEFWVHITRISPSSALSDSPSESCYKKVASIPRFSAF